MGSNPVVLVNGKIMKKVKRIKRKNKKFTLGTKDYTNNNICSHSIGIYDFDDEIENIIKKLTNIKQECENKGYDNISICIEKSHYDESFDFYINGWRKETLEEAKSCFEKEQQNIKKLEKLEKDQYMKLKEKYG